MPFKKIYWLLFLLNQKQQVLYLIWITLALMKIFTISKCIFKILISMLRKHKNMNSRFTAKFINIVLVPDEQIDGLL